MAATAGTIRSITSTISKDTKESPRVIFINCVKRAVFILTLCVTVLLFTLPIVFYYITAYTDLTATNSEGNLLLVDGNNTTACGTFPTLLGMEVVDSSVDCASSYTGALCQSYLTARSSQQCIPAVLSDDDHDQREVIITVNDGLEKTQDVLEEELVQFQSLLVSYPDCLSVAIPFLCHYYFPLTATNCQSPTDPPSLVFSVSQEDCVRVRDGVCGVPWQLAVRFGFGDRLPDCESLPFSNITQDTTPLSSNNTQFPAGTSISNSENITCKDDFILENDTCFPRCDRFEAYEPNEVTALITAEIISSVFGTTVSLLIIILSIVYRQNMFKFPAMFVIFYSINYFLIGVIFLVLAFDRIGLSCSSINLIEALANPTLFCTISGALLQYLSVNTAMLWFFHLSVFFYKTMFPFHAHRLKQSGKTKHLAVVLIIIALLIPMPGVIVALTVSEHHYRFSRFPPTACVTDHHAWFYSTNLVFTITVGTGTCLLITILWLIYQNRSMNAERTGEKQNISNAEKKIILVFTFFIGFGVFSMVHYGLVSGNAEKAIADFTNYFLCESSGHVPGKCSRSVFEKHTRPEMSIVTYYLLGVMPVVILNFVVNWSKLYKSLKYKLSQAIQWCSWKNDNTGTDSAATDSTTNNSTGTTDDQQVSADTTLEQITSTPTVVVVSTHSLHNPKCMTV